MGLLAPTFNTVIFHGVFFILPCHFEKEKYRGLFVACPNIFWVQEIFPEGRYDGFWYLNLRREATLGLKSPYASSFLINSNLKVTYLAKPHVLTEEW